LLRYTAGFSLQSLTRRKNAEIRGLSERVQGVRVQGARGMEQGARF